MHQPMAGTQILNGYHDQWSQSKTLEGISKEKVNLGVL